MGWKLGREGRGMLFLLLSLCVLFACTGTDTGNPSVKGGYTDETETVASGIVRDSLGNPVSQCSVWVHPISISVPQSLAKVLVTADSSSKSLVLVTDSTGEFAFVGLRPGEYSLIAVQAALGIGFKESFRLEAQDTLVLLDTATMRRVEQLVVPLKDYFGDTILIPELGIEWPVTSDTLRVQGIPEGQYTIQSKAQDGATILITETDTITLGPVISWNSDHTKATITDPRDSTIYQVIPQGNLLWMASNLRYSTPTSTCNINDPYLDSNCNGYGRFYSVEEANIVCPTNWHLPSVTEWQNLFDFTGGSLLAGSALKTESGWDSGSGLDLYGFSVLPAGTDAQPAIGTEAYFWTSTLTQNIPQIVNFSAASTTATISGLAGTDKLNLRCVIEMK